jgi:hydroxysqualene synthase
MTDVIVKKTQRSLMRPDHYENFPVASFLCPPKLRSAVVAIYWFARTADDLADEGDTCTAQRCADLAQYRQDLFAAAHQRDYSNRWAHVFNPLEKEIKKHALPLSLLQALLSAFEQDLTHTAYSTRQELLDYCQRSAVPVGRLLLHLYQINDPILLAQSDQICTALQLINFWQDASIDLARGRFYIPSQECARHGLKHSDLLTRQQHNSATQALMTDMVQWAQQLMESGAPLASSLKGRMGWELRLVIQGGLAILKKITQMNYACLEKRPLLAWHDAPGLLFRALRMSASTRH